MKTEGVVLKSKDLGDRLRHLTVYTEKLGKVNLLVKLRSADFPIKYEPFSVTEFKLLQKGERWEVVEGKLVKENFPKNGKELLYRSKIARLLSPLELPPGRRLYRLIKRYMEEEGAPPAYQAFLMKFLFLEGLTPRLFRCIECGSSEISAFSVEKGGVLCRKCGEGSGLRWSREASVEAYTLTKEPLEKLKKKKFRWLNLVETAAEKHLRYRTEK